MTAPKKKAKKKPEPSADRGGILYQCLLTAAEDMEEACEKGIPEHPVGRIEYECAAEEFLKAWRELDTHLREGGNRPHAWDQTTPERLPLLERIEKQDPTR